MSAPFRIGIAGLGTVGAGLVKLLSDNRDLIAGRTGRPVEIVAVNARDQKKDRGVDLSAFTWVDTPATLVQDKNIDAVVELIGGAAVALAIVLVSMALIVAFATVLIRAIRRRFARRQLLPAH